MNTEVLSRPSSLPSNKNMIESKCVIAQNKADDCIINNGDAENSTWNNEDKISMSSQCYNEQSSNSSMANASALTASTDQ